MNLIKPSLAEIYYQINDNLAIIKYHKSIICNNKFGIAYFENKKLVYYVFFDQIEKDGMRYCLSYIKPSLHEAAINAYIKFSKLQSFI